MIKQWESVFSCFVAIVFAIAAGFFIWFLAITFTRHYAAQSWVPVQAEVVNYDLLTSQSTVGRSALPMMQARVVVAYSYVFNGTRYTGNRVDFSFGSDNFSDGRRSKQLAALRNGRITVYVDPGNPVSSVFDRSLPGNQIIFALVFLLFPCGIGTMFTLGILFMVLSKLGLSGSDRFYMPLLGVIHTAPALYPVIFAPSSVGFGGWLILLIFLLLLTVSLRSIWRRVKDESIGQPQWTDRLTKNFPNGKRF